MMSPAYIEHLSTQFAAHAELEELEPYLVESGELQTWISRVARGGLQHLPFPAIGTFEPAGWVETRQLFADSSGFGTEGEPALTNRGLVAELKVGFAYAIGETGQFQVYIREFESASANDTARRLAESPAFENCDHCGCDTPEGSLYSSPYNNAQYCAQCFLDIEGEE